ncbi:MarR family winged helix-turn-helix transcriptional regulator [Caulobacter sp. KR2-114]|uniref:MarR family winged helix-turn-helix transcriptional regulator n=1 Tax=Caulobacter sp. KR2-114 TaxID=3400912 RepID=UPI003C0B6594
MVDRLSRLIGPDPKGEFPFEVSEYLIQALHRAGRFRDLAFEAALQPLRLNMTRYRILVAVVRAGACTMSDLSVLIGHDRTTLARAVDQLVAANLVVRQTVANDRRFVELTATPEGVALFERTVPLAETLNAEIFAGLDDDRKREMLRGLQVILENLDAGAEAVARELGSRWTG